MNSTLGLKPPISFLSLITAIETASSSTGPPETDCEYTILPKDPNDQFTRQQPLTQARGKPESHSAVQKPTARAHTRTPEVQLHWQPAQVCLRPRDAVLGYDRTEPGQSYSHCTRLIQGTNRLCSYSNIPSTMNNPPKPQPQTEGGPGPN